MLSFVVVVGVDVVTGVGSVEIVVTGVGTVGSIRIISGDSFDDVGSGVGSIAER